MLKSISDRLEFWLVLLACSFFKNLPESACRGLARLLGRLGFYLVRKRRRIALENLALVFPEMSLQARRNLVVESFSRLVLSLFECLKGISYEPSVLQRVEVAGQEALKAAVAEGKGVLIVCAHLGNWEMLGTVLAKLGYTHQAIAKQLKNPLLNAWIQKVRAQAGFALVWATKGASIKLLDCLEQGGIVSMLMDQSASEKEAKVRFLKVDTYARTGAALLALSAECPVIATSIVRQENLGDKTLQKSQKHQVDFSRVLLPEPKGILMDDAQLTMQAIVNALEPKILQHPADYLWGHDRFKNLQKGAIA